MSSPPTVATWRRPSLSKQVAGFLVGLIGLLGAFVFLASPAGAHHPVISGTSECATTPGQVKVNYTAESWGSVDTTPDSDSDWGHFISEADIDDSGFPSPAPTDGDSNQYTGHIVLEYKVNGGASWVEVDGNISFTPSQYQVTGSFELPESAFPVELRTTTSGVWKNNASSGANAESSASVSLPNQDCSPDVSNPTASIDWSCEAQDNLITVVLDNSASSGDGSIQYVVKIDGSIVDTVDVPNGDPAVTKTYAGPVEDGPAKVVTVDYDNKTETETYEADCEPNYNPTASIDWSCEAQDNLITVVLDNSASSGDGSIQYVVKIDGSIVDTVDVPNGDPAVTKTYAGPVEDGPAKVVTVDYDNKTETETYEADCEPNYNPTASIDWSCEAQDNLITVVLDNSASSGDGSIQYVVKIDGSIVDTVDVPNGDPAVTKTYAGPVEDGPAKVVTVDYDNKTETETYEADCEPNYNPAAAILDWDCDENITVELDNSESSGDGSVTYTILVDGDVVDEVTIPNGADKQTILLDPPVEDGPAKTVTVTYRDTEISDTFQADCFPPPQVPNPGASSAWECGDDSIVVTLDNGASNVPVTYTVNGTDVTVPAFTTETVELDAPVEDGTAVVVTVLDGSTQLHTASYQADCEEPPPPPVDNPAASSSWECGDTVITVTLDNRGSDVDVTYDVNGAEIEVPAGVLGSFNLPAPVEDGAPVLVTVTDGTDVLHEATYQADCEDEAVLDDDVANPPTTTPPVVQDDAVTQLPRTGSDPMDLAAPGLLILLLGAGFVLVSKELAQA